MKQQISRSEAAEKHLAKFFTGKPCKRGHIAERYVSTGNCCECLGRYRKDKLLTEIRVAQGELVGAVTYEYLTPEQIGVLDQFVQTFREQNAKSTEDRIKHAEFYGRQKLRGRDAAVRECLLLEPEPAPVPFEVIKAISDEHGGKLPDWIVCTGNYVDWNW